MLTDPAGAFERFLAEHGPEAAHLKDARAYTAERLDEVGPGLSVHSKIVIASPRASARAHQTIS